MSGTFASDFCGGPVLEHRQGVFSNSSQRELKGAAHPPSPQVGIHGKSGVRRLLPHQPRECRIGEFIEALVEQVTGNGLDMVITPTARTRCVHWHSMT